MANIYSKWNQGATYSCQSDITELTDMPFFIKQNVFKKKYTGRRKNLPKDFSICEDEKMILCILSAFRSISRDQLRVALKMAGTKLSSTAFSGLIKKLIYFSIIEEVCLCYTADVDGQSIVRHKLKLIRTGRNGHLIGKTFGLKGYSIKQLAILKSSYRNHLANDLTDYVWSQIVIKSLMKSQSLMWFKMDRIMHLKGGMTVLIPLTIMTDSKQYLFEYIITNYEWEITCALQKYEHIAHSQDSNFTLVHVLQSQNLKSIDNVNKKIRDSPLDIVFTTVLEWYSKEAGSIHRISSEDFDF